MICSNFVSACCLAAQCEDQTCFVCSREAAVVLSLRGQCSHSNLDRYFVPDFSRGQLAYHGHLGGKIEYEPGSLAWVLTVRNKTTRAVSQATLQSLALGEHVWQLYEENHACKLENGTSLRLSLTSCGEEEFGCGDGSCQVREELSHWSRSIQILCSHWSRSIQILSSHWSTFCAFHCVVRACSK